MNPVHNLTPEQHGLLFDRGNFLLLKDVPKGSQIGIDGSLNHTLAFAGWKFLPPGLHLAILSPPSTSPVPLPRTGFLFFAKPDCQVTDRTYESSLDSLGPSGSSGTISQDALKGLDRELAPYPFELWDGWKTLWEGIDEPAVERVLGAADEGGRGGWPLDGLDIGTGEEEEERTLGGERVLRHRAEKEGTSARLTEVAKSGPRWAKFDLRKSWKAGADGGEVTMFAQDKSWLLWNVVETQLDGESTCLLHQLSLLLPLSVLLQAPSLFLSTYRRILALFALSRLQLNPSPPPSLSATPAQLAGLPALYSKLFSILAAHLAWLPDGFFQQDLPEAEGFMLQSLEDLEALMRLVGGRSGWAKTERRWEELKAAASEKFGWEVGLQVGGGDMEDEEEDEDDRPVVVEM